ncbi:hypothetical protein FB472_0028 [Rhodoglobus vestalii]|uniref:Uncharacterized protein n=1 Tax=Rhodoglobus vestalii TaxID=193384 RepID=A0A8H2K5S1_9MICO|nr:hypothetical protein FB472_0028 [Rhodoglobus vestalii]
MWWGRSGHDNCSASGGDLTFLARIFVPRLPPLGTKICTRRCHSGPGTDLLEVFSGEISSIGRPFWGRSCIGVDRLGKISVTSGRRSRASESKKSSECVFGDEHQFGPKTQGQIKITGIPRKLPKICTRLLSLYQIGFGTEVPSCLLGRGPSTTTCTFVLKRDIYTTRQRVYIYRGLGIHIYQ